MKASKGLGKVSELALRQSLVQVRPRRTARPDAVSDRHLGAGSRYRRLKDDFVLSSAFAIRHSKRFRLYHPSLLEIGGQLYRSLWQLQPPIRAPPHP